MTDEFFLDEKVTVYNPYKAMWEAGRITAKFYNFTNPLDGHIYCVQVANGETLSDIYEDALLKIDIWKHCECGAHMSNQPGHSHWCPRFDG